MKAEVRFQPSGRSVRVAPGTTLIEATRQAGLPMASACGDDGICGRCGVTVLMGADTLSPETGNEAEVKRRNRIAARQRLACRAHTNGSVEITTSYWKEKS
ncbi:MAG: 2Fe-2S iron-sulfur cluster binding domain-containing protein [Deltaproteobacteria bacterium]|nr:2Fe-2S iron-sulfur cluster binding domain-containing protein [Deltaproteobacteria bacterium]MBW2362369.1 2Fe-2S iron-sulfur cluster binding domain-containing protein [Deltaproteobacteria bacterium]